MSEPNVNGSWRVWTMGVMLTIIIALSGLTYQQNAAAAGELRESDKRQGVQLQDQRDRIVRMEQWIDYQQKQLDRIESGVNELKKRR